MSSPEDPTATTTTTSEENVRKSALQANIETKGKNAYYFAHAHKASGPKWDGKPEPKLLGRQSSTVVEGKKHAFDVHKSTIRKYAFLDDEKSVKLYIDMQGVAEKCGDDDISLDFTETSFCLTVRNFTEDKEECLSFGKLTAPITNASVKKKTDRLILTLTKQDAGVEWKTVNDKGAPDHEVV
jgi:hypothetical protein